MRETEEDRRTHQKNSRTSGLCLARFINKTCKTKSACATVFLMSSTILFSFAHPDDESFSGAGTAMKYAARGVRTVLVTATLGERGKTGDPARCSVEELATVREQELRDAAEIIGFDELHLLGYRDQELSGAKPDDIRRA